MGCILNSISKSQNWGSKLPNFGSGESINRIVVLRFSNRETQSDKVGSPQDLANGLLATKVGASTQSATISVDITQYSWVKGDDMEEKFTFFAKSIASAFCGGEKGDYVVKNGVCNVNKHTEYFKVFQWDVEELCGVPSVKMRASGRILSTRFSVESASTSKDVALQNARLDAKRQVANGNWVLPNESEEED